VSDCLGGKSGFCFDWDIFLFLQVAEAMAVGDQEEEMRGGCGSLKGGLFGPLRWSPDSVLYIAVIAHCSWSCNRNYLFLFIYYIIILHINIVK
jgi:hypothetical protein